MTLTPDRRLQARIAGTLALVVLVNGLLLAILAWSGRRVLSASGRSMPLEVGVPLTVGALVIGAIGLVAVQARYGSRAVVSELEPEPLEGDGPRNVAGRVRRLAAQADVPAPSVAVADRSEPGSLTVGTQRSPTIVVTTGLLETLGDDELDAALAHEIAHVANRDLPVVTAVAAIVAVGDRLLERERLLRRVLETTWIAAVMSGIGLLVLALPILVLGIVYLLVSVTARTLLAVNAIALGLFAKTREYAADRGASQLTGNPSALAGALEALEDERPQRDARVHASAALGIVARPLSLEETSESDDEHWLETWLPDWHEIHGTDHKGKPVGFADRIGQRIGEWIRARFVRPISSRVRRLLGWRPPTHPPSAKRIERLRALERRWQE